MPGYGYGLPGAYLTDNQRFAQMLAQMKDPNNGTTMGGIGSVIMKGLQGYLMGRDMGDEQDAQQVQAQAIQAAQGTPESTITFNQPTRPDGTGEPTQTVPGTPPDRKLAAQLLASNPRTAPQAMAMMQDDYNYNRTRQDRLSDTEAQRQFMRDQTESSQNFQQGQTETNQQFQERMRKEQQDFQRSNGAPIQVPDATSPTGFRYALPKDAVGQPAYNANAPFAGAGGAAPGADLPTGDEALKSVPKPIADQVRALADGRMQFPQGNALKTPYWQQMISMVSQYDPSFDAVNYNARSKTRNDFTSGTSARQINAMNTVMGHLSTLSDAADALNNTSVPAYNAVANYAANATGDPRIKQFDSTRKAVVDELTRVWRGNGGSEGDIKTWSDQINAANSPEQLHGVIGQIGELISSKVNAMGEQYKQGMGKSAEGITLLTPQSQKVLDLLETRAGKKAAASDQGQPATGSAPGGVPEGATATNPQTGQKIVFRGGQWQPAQ